MTRLTRKEFIRQVEASRPYIKLMKCKGAYDLNSNGGFKSKKQNL